MLEGLIGLKVGDRVMIIERDLVGESVVTEITKGGNFRLEGSDKIWLPCGAYSGQDKWSYVSAYRFDGKTFRRIRSSLKEKIDRSKLKNYDFSKLSIKKVREVLAVLEKS